LATCHSAGLPSRVLEWSPWWTPKLEPMNVAERGRAGSPGRTRKWRRLRSISGSRCDPKNAWAASSTCGMSRCACRTASMKLPSDFRELLEEFVREGVEHVVIGGYA